MGSHHDADGKRRDREEEPALPDPAFDSIDPADETLRAPLSQGYPLPEEGPRTAEPPPSSQGSPCSEGESPRRADRRVEWFLESLMDDGRQLRRMPIRPLPFRIGRLPGLDLVLPSQLVSKAHAEIREEGGALQLRDLGSTNGTFVNRSRIQEAPVRDGDVLHFADFEFRVGREERDDTTPDPQDGHATVAFGNPVLPHHFVAGTRELKELMRDGRVAIVFQPIVRFPGGEVAGYEALGRGLHPGLPEDPIALFRIAESLGVAPQLSRLFRRKTVELVRPRKDLPTLFLNTHPAELEQAGLAESLEELRAMAPHLRLALEIHESALGLPGAIQELRARLSKVDVGLAYDDFGAGQARLIELAEAPPNFLKFDRRFVSGIDQAPPAKQRLLASLVAAARELLVETIAEGVATPAEAAVVTRVGFTHAQGFLYGRPVSIDHI